MLRNIYAKKNDMEIINDSGRSKIAAKIRNTLFTVKDGIEVPILNKKIKVTISSHAPESVKLTGALPRTRGWKLITIVPIKENGRKDYIKLIKQSAEKEIWIKVSTAGGRSRVYVR